MMPRKFAHVLLPLLVVGAGAAVAACGSVATPEWAAEAQSTRIAQVATDDHLTDIAPTLTPTPVPPTATPEPPTATSVPPTATPEPPTATNVPPTEVPATEEPAANTAGGGEEVTGDATNGQTVFTTMYTTAQGSWSCAMCHSVTPDEARLIGPGLYNVAQHAETRVEGQSAYDYIHESIVAPDDFIAPGDPPYPAGLMPQNWEEVLTADELNDVIAYLYTLQGE